MTKRKKYADHDEVIDALSTSPGLQAFGETELKITFTGTPNSKGWVDCFSPLRDENNPSGSFNVQTGRFQDFGLHDESISLFDLVAQVHGFTDWQGGKDYCAEYAGLAEPVTPRKIGNSRPQPKKKKESTKKKQGGKREYGSLEKEYKYHNERGQVVYLKRRYRDPKGFSQHRVDPETGEVHNTLEGMPVPLYRLLDLNQADKSAVVYLVEGEKDADRLASLGLTATTNSAGGGKKWNAHEKAPLAGRDVVIIPDNDGTGEKHIEKVCEALSGIANRIRVLKLTGLKPGGDVSDWVDKGGTVEELRKLTDDAPELSAEVADPLPEIRQQVHDALPAKVRDVFERYPLTKSDGRTELANSRRFIALHGDNVRYCHHWEKWLVWDGKRWNIDKCGSVLSLAKDLADFIWTEAGNIQRKEVADFATATSKRAGLSALLKLAESDAHIDPEELDQNEWLLNCPNGTIDLRTGKLREHRREDLISKLCPIEYHADADSSRWEEFLAETLPHEGLPGYIQRFVGYSLTGNTTEHILPIFFGTGSNGKSTVVETLLAIMGLDYSMVADQTLLMATNSDKHPTGLADLHGKRLVVCDETEERRPLHESQVKLLTGGDTIRCRRMRQDFWQFEPTHSIILQTNHKPKISGTDNGIWRRLRLVPFTQTVPEEKRDKDLKAKLYEDASGILRWAVAGAVEWSQRGLQPPKVVSEATKEYRSDEDVISQFIDDRCVVGVQTYRIKGGDLYKAFEEWCESSGAETISNTKFGSRIPEMGFTKKRNNGTWYLGIALKANQPEDNLLEGF